MKTRLAILAIFASLVYGTAAYTRPHEPAGHALHAVLDTLPALELPRVPFSGLLNTTSNEFAPRPTLRPLEVVPPTATPYTPRELSEIYLSH